jgi:hypothetical protein
VSARIILTGDILRPKEEAFRPAQTGNILWLHRLLRRPIGRASGGEVEVLVWGGGPGGTAFDTPAFYAAAGATPDIAGWVRLFDADALPRAALAQLAAAYRGATAVIGFELAEVQKRVLTGLGIPWIDLNIHPCRFGPDLLFAVQTGNGDVLTELARHHAGDSAFEAWADLLAALAVKAPLTPPVTEGLLLVGQTRVDRSLIARGRLLDLRDVAGSLHAVIGREARVLFKPHPYNPDGSGLHEAGLPLSRIRETADNAYLLMASDAVRRVVGISSSLVAEARFFGKEGVFLGTPPFRIPADAAGLEPGMHASVVDAWLSADFWRDLLAPLMPVTAKDWQRPSLWPNALRNALRQFWGWDEIAFQLPFDLAQQRAEERRALGPG